MVLRLSPLIATNYIWSSTNTLEGVNNNKETYPLSKFLPVAIVFFKFDTYLGKDGKITWKDVSRGMWTLDLWSSL